MLPAGSGNPALQPGEPEIWKIRAIKNYPEAHNHTLVGDIAVRVISWSRIEVIDELSQSLDYVHSTVVSDKPAQVLFRDKQHLCPIGRGSAPSY